MRERSLQYKFITIVLSAILIIAIFIGSLSIYEVDNYIQKETQHLIEVTCENEAIKINDTFESMEKSVRIMENYVLSFFIDFSKSVERRRRKAWWLSKETLYARPVANYFGFATVFLF